METTKQTTINFLKDETIRLAKDMASEGEHIIRDIYEAHLEVLCNLLGGEDFEDFAAHADAIFREAKGEES